MAAYTRFLGLRYGFKGQRSRFTALVSLASVLGMALGVASLITVLSVMNGFAGELRGRILALVPHAYVEINASSPTSPSTPGPVELASLGSRLTNDERILATAPFHRETVLLAGPYQQKGGVLVGIDPTQQADVSELPRHLLAGDLAALDEPFTLILGSNLARVLGVIPGDQLRVVLPRVTATPLGLFPRSRAMTVVGLFEVGAQQDGQLAFTSMDSARRLFGDGGTRGLQLHTVDLMSAPALAPSMEALLGSSFTYRPWSETQGTLFKAIRMEKLTVTLLLMGVVLVAAFNIISTLVMAVTEKRRDIAVLRTMGSTPGEIGSIFLIQGLSLALVGVVIGTALGVLLALNVADIVLTLEQLTNARMFDPQVYFISRLPSRLMWGDVLVVGAVSLLLSVFATLYPAWRASRVAPAEVLRYE